MQRTKRILWIIIFSTIIIWVGIGGTKYLKARGQVEDREVNLLATIDLPHSNQVTYEKFQGGVLRYWEGLLIYYNQNGDQQWSTHLGMISPMIRVNENHIYIADKSRNQLIKINNKGQVSYRVTLERPLFNFMTCEEDYLLIQHISKDKLQYVTILNETGKKNGEIVLGEGEIVAISLSKIHDRVGIATLGEGVSGLESKVLMYDLKGKLIGIQGVEDKILLALQFEADGNLIAIGEEGTISIDKNNNIKWSVDIDPPSLIKSSSKQPIIIYSKSQGRAGIIRSHQENRIKMLNYNGKWAGETRFEEEIKGIDFYENRIIAFSSRTIYYMDKKGEIKVKHAYHQDIEKAISLGQGNVVVISKEQMAFIRFE